MTIVGNSKMSTSLRQDIIEDIKTMLGDSLVDVELNPEDYTRSVNFAFDRYRQRAGNATEEAYMFLRLVYEQAEYILPDEIITVRSIFRRGIGETTGGTQLDPFALAYTNMYLLQAGSGGGYTAGLLTYELFYDFQKQAGRMFGRDINFTYNTATKKLSIVRKPTGGEEVLLWVYKYRSDDELLSDPFVKPWIRSYALSWAKQILGEGYSKFAATVGPQGGTTLKGEVLKTEALAMRQELELELTNYIDNSLPIGFVFIG